MGAAAVRWIGGLFRAKKTAKTTIEVVDKTKDASKTIDNTTGVKKMDDTIEETKEVVIERKDKGTDGATSKHIIEKDTHGNTVSKTHQVKDKDGNIIHQHQDHVSTQKNPQTGKYNTRQFPDEWVKYPKKDN